jgi:hypothetical protein
VRCGGRDFEKLMGETGRNFRRRQRREGQINEKENEDDR